MRAQSQVSFRRSSRSTAYARPSPQSPAPIVTSQALTLEEARRLGFPTNRGYFLDPNGNVFEFEVLSAPSFFERGAAMNQPSKAQVRFLHTKVSTDGHKMPHLVFRVGNGRWVCDWFSNGDRDVIWFV